MLQFTSARRLGALALIALLCSLAISVATTQAASPRYGYVVVFRDSVRDPGARTDQLERTHGFASDLRYAHALKGFAAQLSSAQLARLAADPDVAFVSPDATVEAVGTVPVVQETRCPRRPAYRPAPPPACIRPATSMSP